MAKKIGNQSDLEAFLATQTQPEIAADEWTTDMAYKKAVEMGNKVSRAAMKSRLATEEQRGTLVSRKVLIDGKWANVYRKKSAR
jgi:hypothetical protein